MTEQEIHSTYEQLKAAVELCVELFDKIKEGTHYADPAIKLSVFLQVVMYYATNETLQKKILAVLTGAYIADPETNMISVTSSAFGFQSRETNLQLCRSMHDYWEQTYWDGEWGKGGIAPSRSNPGMPECDKPRYWTAGEDLQAGDPVELMDGAIFVHRDMKK